MKRIVFVLLLLVNCGLGFAGENVMENSPQDSKEAMADLRRMALTSSPEHFGLARNADSAEVYGIMMEFRIDDDTISILSMKDGSASLYTTSTFGVIGGGEHESVRRVAQAFVQTAQKYYENSAPTSNFDYPPAGQVRFYLLTYDGVRVCSALEQDIFEEKDVHYELYAAGQDVLTQLRLIVEKEE